MIAIGAGGLAVAVAMGGGAYYITYPNIVKVNLTGKLSAWVSAKDVILEVLRRLRRSSDVPVIMLTARDAVMDKVAGLEDRVKRQMAEFENYRKRTLKEKAELILNGGEKAVSAVLPVIDDMERAIENGAKTDDPAVLREGMELIYNKFIKALEGLGVKKIDTEDADFNTDLHEAVAMVPGMGDDKKGKVIDCLQAGYQLNDKVIRHAKVAVGQ